MNDRTPISSIPASLFRALVPLFAVTLFVSAGLLFWIQPLFAKMALPLLGGAPAVWNTAMMFFQATLLLGYGYVHFIGKKLCPRWQAVIHVIVVVIAFISLPVAVRGGYNSDSDPVLGLVLLLGISIGLPFFAVSATAPLLQRWFALSGHQHAKDPYFLYGASNLGSILVLLAFPLILEPNLKLSEQGIAWSGGFAVLLLLLVICAVLATSKSSSAVFDQTNRSHNSKIEHKWRQRLLWIALSFAPSSLLLGVTQNISTDVAAVPLLWVIPLVLYLLTFVIAFARRPMLPHHSVLRLQPYILVLGLIGMQVKVGGIGVSIAIHLVVFFVLALACHGELVKRRPDVVLLTEFYLCMSIGGLLGGAFNVLAAPILFNGIVEYGIAIMVAAMLRPGIWSGKKRDYLMDIALPLTIIAVAFGIFRLDLFSHLHDYKFVGNLVYFGIAGIAIFGFQERPFRFGLGVGAVLLASAVLMPGGEILTQSRSFFGVYRVKLSDDGLARHLAHGTTIHGTQLLSRAGAREPLGYYSRGGPLGQLFQSLRGKNSTLRVGLVGLGIGSTLCYAKPGDSWTVFEIDPLVAKLARDDRYFSLVRNCTRHITASYLFGDARLRLRGAADAIFDLIILDAYSSDAIPVHLLSKEALALYRKKLAGGGILMFHISNRHLDLRRVLSALVRDTGMVAYVQNHIPAKVAPKHVTSSRWVVVAERAAELSALDMSDKWQTLPMTTLRPWSDNYSNIFDILR